MEPEEQLDNSYFQKPGPVMHDEKDGEMWKAVEQNLPAS